MINNRHFLAILAMSLTPVVAGCTGGGAKIVPVSGVVTLEGKPVAEAAILFSPQAGGRPAVGVSDADGRFQLTTMQTGDGALEGTHSVTVTKVETTGVEVDADGLSKPLTSAVRQVWHVPKKYSSTATSKLTAEVKEGMAPVELKLEK